MKVNDHQIVLNGKKERGERSGEREIEREGGVRRERDEESMRER